VSLWVGKTVSRKETPSAICMIGIANSLGQGAKTGKVENKKSLRRHLEHHACATGTARTCGAVEVSLII
jgi:hypothetical protein